jgi:hypothetical protein
MPTFMLMMVARYCTKMTGCHCATHGSVIVCMLPVTRGSACAFSYVYLLNAPVL